MPLIIPHYGKRNADSNSIEVKRKFYFVYEGNKTEAIYFNGLKQHSKEIGIN